MQETPDFFHGIAAPFHSPRGREPLPDDSVARSAKTPTRRSEELRCKPLRHARHERTALRWSRRSGAVHHTTVDECRRGKLTHAIEECQRTRTSMALDRSRTQAERRAITSAPSSCVRSPQRARDYGRLRSAEGSLRDEVWPLPAASMLARDADAERHRSLARVRGACSLITRAPAVGYADLLAGTFLPGGRSSRPSARNFAPDRVVSIGADRQSLRCVGFVRKSRLTWATRPI